MKPTIILLCTLPFVFTLTACGSSIQLPEGVLSPCDIEGEPLGSSVKVGGEINFLDDSIPGEIYADLEAEGCRVGLTVPSETLDTWGSTARQAIQMGAQIIIEGRLDELALPGRPDEYQYVVALASPPTLLNEAALEEQSVEEPVLAELHGLACDFSSQEPLEALSIDGELIHVDESAAAGVAGELDRGDCHVHLWVERRFWDEWSQQEMDRFSVGSSVSVEGILTYVLGEAVLDIADPPTSK
jgi:hypothetical protein